jgi:hypothetical protein
LLIRLTDEEAARFFPDEPKRRFLDKGEDGYCCFLDRKTRRCRTWPTRPQVCREYDCNEDSLLQVAIRSGFTSLVDLVLKDRDQSIPTETYRLVDYIDHDSS